MCYDRVYVAISNDDDHDNYNYDNGDHNDENHSYDNGSTIWWSYIYVTEDGVIILNLLVNKSVILPLGALDNSKNDMK